MAKNRFDFEAHLSRHPHNVSAGYTSSLTTGPIVPQYFDVLGPGDTLYFTPKCFARMQDIVAPFFGEVSLHFDAFFVPLQMMYTVAGQIFTQTNDVISNFFVASGQNVQKDNFPLLKTSWHANKDLRTPSNFPLYREAPGKELMRLLDALDCNALSVLSASNFAASEAPSGTPRISDGLDNIPSGVSPWLFAAYQACYQKKFRNDDFEKFDISAFNFDTAFNSDAPFENEQMYQLRYCQRPNDYFTSLKVSPLSSAVNSSIVRPSDAPGINSSRFPSDGGSLIDTLESVNDYLGFGSSNYVFEQKRANSDNIYPNSASHLFGDDVSSFAATSSSQSESWFPTAANIRALFAVDKFTRIYGRAGKTYDEQIEAHFGIKIPHDVKHDLTHLHHWRMSLAAEPVYSTAGIVGGSSLGQVGGQANNTLQAGQEKFTAPVHGVFMITCYAVTKPRYFMTFNKLNLLASRLDFPIPEFDKLGMQPLYLYETYPNALKTDDDKYNMSVRIGWQRRYQQFKQKYNRVSPLYYNTDVVRGISSASNAFSPYVLSRTFLGIGDLPAEGSAASGWSKGQSNLIFGTQMFERPNALDGVMAVSYERQWSHEYWQSPQSVFDTDPIILDFYCDAKKVSWMSETGEPDL